jgi:transcriptional regulator with XRE-family HTH domain
MSTWAEYVERITGGASQTAVAEKAGISQSAVNRWRTVTPKPETVIALARAYDRPLLEAFIAAGWLSKDDTALTEIRSSVYELSDDVLLAEVRRRMAAGR